MPLKFVRKVPIDNIPAMVQIMAWRRPGDKPLSEPIMVSLLTHICVIRPQWVNSNSCCPFMYYDFSYMCDTVNTGLTNMSVVDCWQSPVEREYLCFVVHFRHCLLPTSGETVSDGECHVYWLLSLLWYHKACQTRCDIIAETELLRVLWRFAKIFAKIESCQTWFVMVVKMYNAINLRTHKNMHTVSVYSCLLGLGFGRFYPHPLSNSWWNANKQNTVPKPSTYFTSHRIWQQQSHSSMIPYQTTLWSGSDPSNYNGWKNTTVKTHLCRLYGGMVGQTVR